MSELQRESRTGNGYARHIRGFFVVLPPLHRPEEHKEIRRPEESGEVDAGGPLFGRSRTHDDARLVLPFLAESPVRHEAREGQRAVHAPHEQKSHFGARRSKDVKIAWERYRPRRSCCEARRGYGAYVSRVHR